MTAAVATEDARLKKIYLEKVVPALQQKFGYKNPMEVPRLEKIVINMGVGKAALDKKAMEFAVNDLAAIAGQKPVVTRARKSEAVFKIRQGMAIGCKVTLRKKRMYEFLDRLVNIAMPSIRDFRGISPRSFDGQGNYAFGIKEHLIFPEINYDKTDGIRGMDIIICTTAKTDEEARELLRGFNMPFWKN